MNKSNGLQGQIMGIFDDEMKYLINSVIVARPKDLLSQRSHYFSNIGDANPFVLFGGVE